LLKKISMIVRLLFSAILCGKALFRWPLAPRCGHQQRALAQPLLLRPHRRPMAGKLIEEREGTKVFCQSPGGGAIVVWSEGTAPQPKFAIAI
jgi:hypothetical protein